MEGAKDDIVDSLCQSVRVLTGVQIEAKWFAGRPRRAAQVLQGLKRKGLIESLGRTLSADMDVTAPLLRWCGTPGRPTPNFRRLEYRLRIRLPELKCTELFRASSKAIQAKGKNKRRPARRADWSHDIGLSRVWLNLRHELAETNSQWILEDDLQSLPELSGLRKPDAVVKHADGLIRLIEFGGHYSEQVLLSKHESWIDHCYEIY